MYVCIYVRMYVRWDVCLFLSPSLFLCLLLTLLRPVVALGVLDVECEIGLTGRNHADGCCRFEHCCQQWLTGWLFVQFRASEKLILIAIFEEFPRSSVKFMNTSISLNFAKL